MLGAAAWSGVRTNFLNFIALPITFGIGVDYGINIYLRYQVEGRGRVGRAVRATGGAVVLCSLTTIIGYAALLLADNQALRSFGEMAILGEVACLSAAVVGMPAFLAWRERRQNRLEARA
jgi:predicted RND superfamily exporter protein